MLSKKVILITLLCSVVTSCLAGPTPTAPIDLNMGTTTPGYLEGGAKSGGTSFGDAVKTTPGIRSSGTASDELDKPWCSHPDGIVDSGEIQKRYLLGCNLVKGNCNLTKWPKVSLDYKIFNYPQHQVDLTNASIDKIISGCWNLWANASITLSFRKTDSDNATLKISFLRGEHGDRYSFNQSKGQSNVLAHAFFPPGGKSLAWTACHEFGHALGMNHSDKKAAVMYGFSKNLHTPVVFDQDDIDGIRELYPSAN
ncbi:hypothetical protein HELRODRAFT_183218 [Helobdella robusta]|uniref:Peptidase metallopeptidase domain-containing protein n=1 Tax=Helobdella robusta TaxID=6412 RepID=T1FJB9_HELRO|nr:hypothetical protein HELRODRAFT_183218 [Helobdella robusta]ESO11432.1 hypothetical protein HELRODRAFT_183218 [Helobdella robusta]